MYSVSVLLGFFVSSVGLLLFFATRQKRFSIPLVAGGLLLAVTMIVMAKI